MAFINCPQCGAKLADYSIDVVARGGTLVGRGGIICPQCEGVISNQEIMDVVAGASAAPARARPSKDEEEEFAVLLGLLPIAVLFLGAAVFAIYELFKLPFEWYRLLFLLLAGVTSGSLGVLLVLVWVRTLSGRINALKGIKGNGD